ncbi:MAG: hypothetical protein LAT54_00490 [Cryomorphaceae bacterium]|nr:hypothetical protein [Cryomorphaceae bacterium]
MTERTFLFLFVSLFISHQQVNGQFSWVNVEKELTFKYGLTQQENGAIPVEIMTRNNDFINEFAPITSEGTSSFNPSYTRNYGLDFGLRFFFNEHWFAKTNLGVSEQFFGYSKRFENDEYGFIDVNTRLKYFAIPFSMGGGYSFPFDWDEDGNVGAINIYVNGFFNTLISPSSGVSEITAQTFQPLENGNTYTPDSPIIDGINRIRLIGTSIIYGATAGISFEFNELTFLVEYRQFQGIPNLSRSIENTNALNQNIRSDWYGHSIEFGVSFRFY